ncbi:MAG: tetraacyldisaccharide 4'-kinase [Moraxellaceae bacterium]|nr:tetraacyldisaccharide 4'-kinase [Moraxellaceae bacterium]
MSQRLVNAWYKGHWALCLLAPLSLLYGLISVFRRIAYQQGWFRSHKFNVPVIVVGNISAGGTGKTPLTLAIVNYLKEQGYHPVIVSRGYGGQTEYPALVTAQSTAQQVGDEPLLMFLQSQVPVVVAPKRAEAVAYVVQHNLGNVVLCDDGLQHYALARDIEIAVIDGARGLGNNHFLPQGALRESAQRLTSVDFVVINGEGYRYPQAHYMFLEASACVPVATSSSHKAPVAPQKIHAVAGIGNPERFFKQLQQQGFEVIKHAFADHHQFVAADFTFDESLPIVMTAKDAVKCQQFVQDNMWQVPVTAQLPTNFYQQLSQKLAQVMDK